MENKKSELKVYDKTTAASRSKRIKDQAEMSPATKALENKHNLGWFARPEKFIDDRPSSISSRNKKQVNLQQSNS
jgi:hypothetical protein